MNAMSNDPITLELAQQADYRFEIRFGDPALPVLVTDEPPPLGAGAGPNPARLLGAAVANCLAASLLFALRKFNNKAEPLRAVAHVALARNERNRMRIGRIDVILHLGAPAGQIRSLDRVLAQFEDFCIVTQSVRAGIEVNVQVVDRDGKRLTPPAAVPPATSESAAAMTTA
jgi:organic hydroperoxide reductase OsmC/OhrA